MKKFIFYFAILFTIFLNLYEVKSNEFYIGQKTTASIYINDEKIDISGYNVLDNNYFRLRDLAYYMKNMPHKFNIS